MKRALLILLVLLVMVPLAAVAAVQWSLGGDAVRTRLADAVRRATGRELSIAGPISVAWSLTPTVSGSDVRLSNPPGFSRPDFLRAGRVEARIALLPLFSRRVVIELVRFERPDVLLERDAQGRPNWDLRPPPTPPSAQPSAPSSNGARFALDLGRLELVDGRVAFRGGEGWAIGVPRLSYQPADGAVAGTLSVHGVPVTLGGIVGPVAAGPVPLALQAAGGGVAALVSGSGAAPEVALDAPDLSTASTLAGTALPPIHELHVKVAPVFAPGSVALRGLQASSTEGDVVGDVQVAWAPRPSVRGALRSQRLDVDALLAAANTMPAPAPVAPAPVAPPSAAAPAPPATVAAAPDRPLPFAALREADADLQLGVGEATWHGRIYRGVAAHAVLAAGKLQLDPGSLQVGNAVAHWTVSADSTASPPTLALTVAAPGLPAGPALALLGVPAGSSGTVDFDAQLAGNGATEQAQLASLGGHVGLAAVDGEVDNHWLETQLSALLRAVNLPLEAGGTSKLRCAAVRADAEAGQVQVKTLVLDTRELTLEGSGSVDLRDRTLELHLRPQLRLGTSLSVPVQVRGTFAAPKVALDPGAIAPGRVGITIGGPPPADPCGQALAAARDGKPGAPPPPPFPAPAGKLKPADLLRSLLR